MKRPHLAIIIAGILATLIAGFVLIIVRVSRVERNLFKSSEPFLQQRCDEYGYKTREDEQE